MDSIVSRIESELQQFFDDGIHLKRRDLGKYIAEGYSSPAWNIYNNGGSPVNAVKWFDDFWIYMEITFIRIIIEPDTENGISREDYLKRISKQYLKIKKDFFRINITISVFHGEYDIKSKSQLFRAEWEFEDDIKNPQPHWHFYTDNEKPEKKSIDLKRLHFAMNGQWASNGSHIHSITDKQSVVNWTHGVIGHIKTQLEDCKHVVGDY